MRLGQMDRRGFTAVELLVVIGVIGVVLSILVPVLARARSAAQTGVSLSNARQIAMGIVAETASNGGKLPENRTLVSETEWVSPKHPRRNGGGPGSELGVTSGG
ncbi:MAG: prepilin-type N-terminal cleavage/methylation domain-containing protein, partial [Planctomycetota bacterium]